jgi:signal transduction histidine kinase
VTGPPTASSFPLTTTTPAPGATVGAADDTRVQVRRWLPPERRRGLDRVVDWPLRRRLVAIIALPVVATVVLAGLRVGGLVAAADGDAADAALSRAQRAAGDLATAVGAEQVTSAALAVGPGAPGAPPASDPPGAGLDRDRLAADRDATDEAADRLDRALAGPADPGPSVRERAEEVGTALDRLAGVRARLDTLGKDSATGAASRTDALTAVREMTEVSGTVLRLGDALAARLRGEEVEQLARGSQALTAAERDQTTQDALVLVAVSRWGEGAVDPDDLHAAEEARLAAVTDHQDLATPGQRSVLESVLTSQASAARATALHDVLSASDAGEGPAPSLTPVRWLELAASSRAELDDLRRARQDEQVALAVAQRRDHLDRAAAESLAAAVLLGLGLAVTVLAARSILLPLRRLRADAIMIAEERLPAAIDRIRDAGPDGIDSGDIQVHPVDVRTTEEIGQVARAFDAVHVEAVRLAADQEQLRRNVNELFVNLSRRSQALVERQLALIDRLENDETDPDQLAQLFRLDHLAARMRRNNDNLMVLAGSDASRGAGRALRVVDVVRAAVSETEQYERVTVRAAPHVTVAAATSHDLVHLLAELLDNATVFSAPDTTVTVDVQGSAREGMRIEVADRGLGIPSGDLDELNAKLSEPPVVDAGVPRQMGLFVVAHLARRHGIRVALQPGPDGRGMTAVVHVPPAVLVAPDGEAPAATPSTPSVAGSTAASAVAPSAPAVPSPTPSAEPLVPTFGAAFRDGGVAADDTRPQPTVRATPVGAANGVPSSNGSHPAGGAPPAHRVPAAPEASRANGAAPTGDPGLPTAPEPAPEPLTGPLERVGSPELTPASHTDPWEVPSEEETPIFRELSAWFRASTPGTGAVRAPEPLNGAPRPARPAAPAAPAAAVAEPARGGTVHRIPSTPVVTEPAVSSAAFASAADEGWQAAAAAEANQPAELTPAGLPRRRPMAQLVPGSAPSAQAAAPARRPRDADAVRGRLANYQRGLQSGRNRVRSAPDGSTPPPSDTDTDQSDQRRYAP